MILFVSGRCDIPAFFSEWFMHRYHEGFVDVRNPYNAHQISRIPIHATYIDCIVFCTKNPKPMLKYLNEIQIPFLFHITLTPYHTDIEPAIGNKKAIFTTIEHMSSMLGKERIILRYDPILLSKRYTIDYHVHAFEKVCKTLHGKVSKIIISFVDMYKNTKKNMCITGIRTLQPAEMILLAKRLGCIATQYAIDVQTCAEDIDLTQYHIHKGLCFDKNDIEKYIGHTLHLKGSSVRKECACLPTVDIGDYNCCPHMCKYCYANYDESQVVKRMKMHNPKSSVLIGELSQEDRITIRKDKKEAQLSMW